ncbi:hypothetical protein LEMLEM_LOCUS4907, partial [Lemmus lemmus]
WRRILLDKPPAGNYTLPWYSPWLCWILSSAPGESDSRADGGLRCPDLKLHCADGFDYRCNINSSIPITGTHPAVLGW